MMRSHRLGLKAESESRSINTHRPGAQHFKLSVSGWWQRLVSRVVDGRLLVRVESRRNTQDENRCDIEDTETPEAWSDKAPACQHVQNLSKWKSTCENMIESLRSTLLQRPVHSTLYRCSSCPSEFNMMACTGMRNCPPPAPKKKGLFGAAFGTRQTVGPPIPSVNLDILVIWQWVDLGTCIARESKEWQSLTSPVAVDNRSGEDDSLPKLPYPLDGMPSIKARFEGKGIDKDDDDVEAL